jgi:hypothetical protein
VSFRGLKKPLDHEKRLFKADILAIDRVKEAFAQRQVMNSVEQVRFARSVQSCEAIDPFGKIDARLFIIAEM